MRKIWTSFALLGSILVLVAGTAFAGDYHRAQQLICADCHTMHYSQSHGASPSGTAIFTPLGAAGPYEFLLRNDIDRKSVV